MIQTAVRRKIDIRKPLEFVTGKPLSFQNLTTLHYLQDKFGEKAFTEKNGTPKWDILATLHEFVEFDGVVIRSWNGRKFIECAPFNEKCLVAVSPYQELQLETGSSVTFFLALGYGGPMAWNITTKHTNILSITEASLGPPPSDWNTGKVSQKSRGYGFIEPINPEVQQMYPKGLFFRQKDVLFVDWNDIYVGGKVFFKGIKIVEGKSRPLVVGVTITKSQG